MQTLQRQWVAITIALLALFVALGGPATAGDLAGKAARQVTGKQIKDGTIGVKDLSPKARKALAGKTGPAGAVGPAGPAGPAGSIAGAPAAGDLTGSYPNPQIGPNTVGVAETDVVPALQLFATTNSIPDDGSAHGVVWGGPELETEPTMFDAASPDRLVAPVAGLYLAHVSVAFNASATGTRSVAIAINGNNSDPACFDRDITVGAGAATWLNATCTVVLGAGEYVSATATQNSGAALGMSGFQSASLTWIGTLP